MVGLICFFMLVCPRLNSSFQKTFLVFGERAFRSRFTLREGGQVELFLGRRPTDLARVQACQKFQDSVNKKCRASSYIAALCVAACVLLTPEHRLDAGCFKAFPSVPEWPDFDDCHGQIGIAVPTHPIYVPMNTVALATMRRK